MIHLSSDVAIEYFQRLTKNLSRHISAYEDNTECEYQEKYASKGAIYAPATYYYLHFLFSKYLDLITYYNSHGRGEPGVYITKSGFPSLPSLMADIRTIYDKISTKFLDLETTIKQTHSQDDILNLMAVFRLSRMDIESWVISLNSQLNNINPRKQRLEFERDFFSEFFGENAENNYLKNIFRGKFFLEEKEGDFILTEELKYPSINHLLKLPYEKLRLDYLGKGKKYTESINGQDISILIDKYQEFKIMNYLKARYFDTEIYEIENPILKIIADGSDLFADSTLIYDYTDLYENYNYYRLINRIARLIDKNLGHCINYRTITESPKDKLLDEITSACNHDNEEFFKDLLRPKYKKCYI